MRILAFILGLVGVAIAFVVNLLYSSFHVLSSVVGIANDQTHFFWGLVVIFVGLVGSVFALFIPSVAMVLLLVAGIAFFFIAGWWALFASPFLLVAAFFAYRKSRR